MTISEEKFDDPLTEQEAARAWHDITCLDRQDCTFRDVHGLASPLVSTGMLEKFFDSVIDTRRARFERRA